MPSIILNITTQIHTNLALGYVWLCIAMYDYVWSVWLCMAMYGYVWMCILLKTQQHAQGPQKQQPVFLVLSQSGGFTGGGHKLITHFQPNPPLCSNQQIPAVCLVKHHHPPTETQTNHMFFGGKTCLPTST